MKIGVISDIHANKYSLKAALRDMDVQKLICCGDIVGYGPHPLESLKIVKEEADIIVQGNHDRWVTSPIHYNNPEVVYSLKYAQDQLHNHHIQWLQNLQHKLEGKDAVIFHSHPTDRETRILPDDTQEFNKYYSNKKIIYGHTHHPCNNKHRNIQVINPGSTSQPRGNYEKPTYAIIKQDKTEIKTIDYDHTKTISDIENNPHLPNQLIQRFKK